MIVSLKNRLFTALTLVIVALPTVVSAQGNCTNASLNGSYGLHATGVVIGLGDFAAVGRFTFDGKGNLTGKLFVRLNGNNNELTLTGAYTVKPDCTVSDVWNFSDGSSSTHTSVLVNEGKEYFILNTTSGEPSVISGEARRQ
jgi:hypothetical protein